MNSSMFMTGSAEGDIAFGMALWYGCVGMLVIACIATWLWRRITGR
jgi:hypothetical protein